jgi:ADP-ribose pyrophosphatase
LAEERTVSSKYIYRGRVVNLRVDTVVDHGGRETIREVVEHAECVAVIAVDDNGDILLVEQYRKGPERALLEIPAGGIDEGESPEDAVIREMQEEIGFRPSKLLRLGGFYSTPGFSNEYLYLYLAEDLHPGRLYAEDTDEIKIIRIKPDRIIDMIESGEICDSKSAAGLLYYLEYRRKQQA